MGLTCCDIMVGFPTIISNKINATINIFVIYFWFIDVKDYTGGKRVIIVPAGVMTKSFTIDIANNNIVECNKIFNVTIVSVTTCGVTIGNNNRSEVTIADDDGKGKCYCVCYIR